MKAKDKRKQNKEGPQSEWDKNQKEILKEQKKKKSEKLQNGLSGFIKSIQKYNDYVVVLANLEMVILNHLAATHAN